MADVQRDQKATTHRLREAKSKGQVARSTDLVAAIVLTGAAVAISTHGMSLLKSEFALAAKTFDSAGRLTDNPEAYTDLIARTIGTGLGWLAPFFCLLVVLAILANVAHTGITISSYPLQWDLSRLSPAKGLKRIFSLKGAYNTVRIIVKLLILGIILGVVATGYVRHFIHLGYIGPLEDFQQLMRAISAICARILPAMLVLALIDFGYAKFQFARDMRMSRREIKDDAKKRDGDPRIRARIRQLRLEAYKRSMSAQHVKKADVLIVNPTHVAVALKYDHDVGGEPVLIAKGVGSLAKKMRQAAASAGIPIVENRPLARAIFKRLELQQTIPEDLFSDVARIIVWVLARKRASTTMSSIR